MKTRLILFSCIVLLGMPSFAQKKSADTKSKTVQQPAKPAAETPAPKKVVDFKKKPGVGEMRDVEFPRYSEATLANGLKVYVVEDHKQPTIAYRLQVGAGESMDAGNNGLSYLMTNLIYKGTQRRSAAAVADEIGRAHV